MNKYQTILRLLELESFSKVADEIGYSQSAISQMLSSVEKELNTTIFDRNKRHLKISEEGRLLLPYIYDLAAGFDRLSRKAEEIKGIETGTIRIGTFTSVSCHLLPDYLKLFHTKYPNVSIELMHGDYGEIEMMIKSGKVDFGFLDKTFDEDLEIEAFKQDYILAVVPSNHRLAKKDTITKKSLFKEPFILPIVRDRVTDDALYGGKGTPNVFFSVQDDYTIMSMVEKGLGVSMLPETVLARNIYDIKKIPLYPAITRNITIAYKKKELLSNAALRFIRLLKAEVE